MSWLNKWFTVKDDEKVNRLEVELAQLKEEVSQAFMDNELAHKAMRSKLNESAGCKMSDLHPKAPNVNDPYPYSPYMYNDCNTREFYDALSSVRLTPEEFNTQTSERVGHEHKVTMLDHDSSMGE